MRATPMAGLCVVLGACASGGGAPTATGSASLAPGATASASGATPTPRPELLFAVLEAHGDHANVPLQDDTIAVVGLDGVARAKATFTPRSRPFIGNAAAVLEPEAHVAAGAVFYVDGQGTVRRLHAGAPPATVTTFPFLTSQTEFSFAVSGDGTALAASGFTFPPQASPPPCDQPMACPFGAGPYRIDVATASSGGSITSVRHEERPQSTTAPDHIPAVLGWDARGWLMTDDMVSGTQQGIGDRLWHGDVGHMDSSGHAGAPLLGGAGCEPWTQLTGGEVVCAPAQGNQVTIRSASGATLWTFDGQPFDGYLAASPDGRRIATLFAGAGESAVVHARDGTSTALPTGFEPEGWLDSGTLIGVRAPGAIQGAMAVVHLSNASRLVDLGFTGSFVGVVQNAG